MMDQEAIAKAIFDWLNDAEGPARWAYGSPPYCYNPDRKALTILVDGMIDCRDLARFIAERERS